LPNAFSMPIALERATGLASMVLIMRNTAPPRAMMETRNENWLEIFRLRDQKGLPRIWLP